MRTVLVAINLGCFGLMLFFATCRKADVFPDYEPLIGKYRCIFIQKSFNDTSGNGTHDTIYPLEEYTVEFKKNRKVIMSRNGECVMDRKVIRCEGMASQLYPRVDFELRADDEYTLRFKTEDTMFIDPTFFPGNYYDQNEAHVFYTTYFVKE